ncbi:dynein regulatory complex protein 10-like [Gigantopelta aegis]|uniref:dynein regulatory complex protein 10-like n=1 Tax=Gigantopelta aegis TaxID=1735272 RepID=UPI001B888059|nr:dynein regulatory complex protein 10-like [Gigantopelta aegis]
MSTLKMSSAMTVTTTIKPVGLEPTVHMKLQPPSKPSPSQNTVRLRKLRLDPSRALEPTRKKLTTIESQRVMSVFEETIKRVEIVTLLPYILENIDRFKIVLGIELVEMLLQHIAFQDSYQDIRSELDKQLQKRLKSGKSSSVVKGSQFDDADDDQQEEADTSRKTSASSTHSLQSLDGQAEHLMRQLTLIAQKLSHSCKNILRVFSLNPAAMNAITAECEHRKEDCKELVGYLLELKEILLGKLLTTPEEENERMEYLKEISKRERNNAVIIEKLEGELKAAIEDKDEEIRKKNDIIRHLSADVTQINNYAEEHNWRIKQEAEKQEAADIKNCEGKCQKLHQEITHLRTQLHTHTVEHRDSEQELRKKKYKIETEVENWIQKYDQDMGERQDEYEEIDAVYTEEKKQLHELEERFKTLEAEYLQIMEERRAAREKREQAERELALMVKAATTIQAFWRSYKVRKALKSKKKKGGGKKKKK